MDIPIELLDRALAMDREDLERDPPEDPEIIRNRLSVEIKASLPEEVRDYLQVETQPGGGHYFWLDIPGCLPISLRFTRRISGLELMLGMVIDQEERKQRSFSSLILAIG